MPASPRFHRAEGRAFFLEPVRTAAGPEDAQRGGVDLPRRPDARSAHRHQDHRDASASGAGKGHGVDGDDAGDGPSRSFNEATVRTLSNPFIAWIVVELAETKELAALAELNWVQFVRTFWERRQASPSTRRRCRATTSIWQWRSPPARSARSACARRKPIWSSVAIDAHPYSEALGTMEGAQRALALLEDGSLLRTVRVPHPKLPGAGVDHVELRVELFWAWRLAMQWIADASGNDGVLSADALWDRLSAITDGDLREPTIMFVLLLVESGPQTERKNTLPILTRRAAIQTNAAGAAVWLAGARASERTQRELVALLRRRGARGGSHRRDRAGSAPCVRVPALCRRAIRGRARRPQTARAGAPDLRRDRLLRSRPVFQAGCRAADGPGHGSRRPGVKASWRSMAPSGFGVSEALADVHRGAGNDPARGRRLAGATRAAHRSSDWLPQGRARPGRECPRRSPTRLAVGRDAALPRSRPSTGARRVRRFLARGLVHPPEYQGLDARRPGRCGEKRTSRSRSGIADTMCRRIVSARATSTWTSCAG